MAKQHSKARGLNSDRASDVSFHEFPMPALIMLFGEAVQHMMGSAQHNTAGKLVNPDLQNQSV